MSRRFAHLALAGWMMISMPAAAFESVDAKLHALASAQLIGEIDIHGNAPFLMERVRRQLTIHPGDAYNADDVHAQIERLKSFYERQGYFNTTVTTQSTWHPYGEEMRVSYSIHRGHSLRWGKLHVDGNTLFTPERMRTFFPMSTAFTPRRLRESTRKLAAAYQHRGYAKARVRVTNTTADFAHGVMDLDLHVILGPHIEVCFEGNTKIPDVDLRRVLTFFDEGRFDSYEIDASSAAILHRYIDRGFLETEVHATRTHDSETVQRVTFHIVEGTPRAIWHVGFAGNQQKSRTQLQEQILTQPVSFVNRGILDPTTLAEDRVALQDYYRQAGFLDAKIHNPSVATMEKNAFYDVTIPIEEGAQYFVGDVTFSGNDTLSHDELLRTLKLRPKQPANTPELLTDKQFVQLFELDHGYPYAAVTQQIATDSKKHLVNVHYDINPGPHATFGEIIVNGNFLTTSRAIHKALRIHPGDEYSDKAIVDAQVRLRRLGAFRNVTIERLGLDDHATTIPLAVRVEEEKPFFVDLDFGYATDDKIVGGLRFTNINSFGFGKRTQFLLLGGKRRARAELSWIDPRFFGSDLLWTMNAWIDRTKYIAFDAIQSGGATGLFRQYHRTGFHARYQLAQNRLLNAFDPATALAEGRRDSSISQLSTGVTYDTRNNFGDPTNGTYLFGDIALFNEIYGLRANFLKTQGGASYYYDLWRGVVLSQHGRASAITGLGAADIPITERFFLGGDDTVRGFSEDSIGNKNAADQPLGGNIRLIYNAELTAPIGLGMRLATFFDAGSLTNSWSEIHRNTIRTTVGVGLRYLTPIGPIRADYGFKLDQQPGESSGRLHFTFGNVF